MPSIAFALLPQGELQWLPTSRTAILDGHVPYSAQWSLLLNRLLHGLVLPISAQPIDIHIWSMLHICYFGRNGLLRWPLAYRFGASNHHTFCFPETLFQHIPWKTMSISINSSVYQTQICRVNLEHVTFSACGDCMAGKHMAKHHLCPLHHWL